MVKKFHSKSKQKQQNNKKDKKSEQEKKIVKVLEQNEFKNVLLHLLILKSHLVFIY